MTHNVAVETIRNLTPQIQKSGAEAALLQHARKEKLPPALLEKLAQTYNTMRTLSHIEKAADRGSAPDGMIDVPQLVVSYAIEDEPSAPAIKRAAEESHDIRRVDLMRAIRREVTPPPPEVEKAAAVSFTHPGGVRVSRDEFFDTIHDLDAEAALSMDALYSEFSKMADNGSVDISAGEENALHVRSPEMVSGAIDWLQKVARFSLRRHEGPLRPRAIQVMDPVGEKIVRLVDAYSLRQTIKEAAATLTKAPRGPDTSSEPINELDLQELEDSLGPDPFAQYDEGGAPQPQTSSAPEADPYDPPDAQDKGGDGKTRSSSGGGAKPPTKVDAPGKTPEPKRPFITAPLKAIGNAASSVASTADKILSDIVSKDRTNSDQRRTDVSVADIRRMVNFRRMVGTDDVLKHQDPRQVAEVYNSIARLHPEIAHDMNAVRLILREATSYEGLPLDSQKMLTDVRKGTADAEAKEAENDKRRYALGTPPLLSPGGSGGKPKP